MISEDRLPSPYEAVLFDIGNVVMQIHFKQCFAAWAKATGRSAAEVEKKFRFDHKYAAHETAGITGREYHQHICSLLESDMNYQDFENGWNAIFGDVIPETQKLIEELQGRFKIYAFTNSNIVHRSHWSVEYKTAFKHFDQIFCSSQLGFRKPGMEGFEKICSLTKIPKDRFIFIDDLPENIAGAERYGIKSVLFDDPKSSTDNVRALLKV